jgi:hypothetical protein
MILIDKTMSIVVGCMIGFLYMIAAKKKDGRKLSIIYLRQTLIN